MPAYTENELARMRERAIASAREMQRRAAIKGGEQRQCNRPNPPSTRPEPPPKPPERTSKPPEKPHEKPKPQWPPAPPVDDDRLLIIALTFGGQTLADLRAALAEAEAQVTGGLSPRVLPMAEIRDLGALLQRAGFALPVADSFNRRVSHRDGLHLMRDLRAMGEGNALAGRLRHFTRREVLLRAASALPTDAEGRVVSDFEVICLTGWAPHESQQKPLRPGSAMARLEDALKAATKEGS